MKCLPLTRWNCALQVHEIIHRHNEQFDDQAKATLVMSGVAAGRIDPSQQNQASGWSLTLQPIVYTTRHVETSQYLFSYLDIRDYYYEEHSEYEEEEVPCARHICDNG